MLFTQNVTIAKEMLFLGNHTEYDHHIHTKHSDGSFSLREVIEFAKTAKLKRIVITDHNTILDATKELKTIPTEFLEDLEVFIGAEIGCKILDKTTGLNIPIELLYYGPNAENVQSFINKYHYGILPQEEQLKFLIQQCEKNNLKHSQNLKVPDGMYATEYLCKDLNKYPENKAFFDATHPVVYTSPKLFFKKFCINPKSDFYIDTTKNLPTASEVADMAKQNGGVTIVAHPCLYVYEEKNQVLDMLKFILENTQVQGLEVFHSSHTLEQRNYLYEFAKQNHFLIGGGSDFHSGPNTIVGFGKKSSPLSICGNEFDWIRKLYI